MGTREGEHHRRPARADTLSAWSLLILNCPHRRCFPSLEVVRGSVPGTASAVTHCLGNMSGGVGDERSFPFCDARGTAPALGASGIERDQEVSIEDRSGNVDNPVGCRAPLCFSTALKGFQRPHRVWGRRKIPGKSYPEATVHDSTPTQTPQMNRCWTLARLGAPETGNSTRWPSMDKGTQGQELQNRLSPME